MGIVAVVLSTGSQTAIGADYATRVIEFRPAPGQFMNLEITTDPSGVPGPVAGAGSEPATDGIVSLGAFGGYIVLGFDRPIVNDLWGGFHHHRKRHLHRDCERVM